MKKILLLTLTLLAIASMNASAQNRVSGKVTLASDGSPAAFVYVMVEGTTIGSQTNDDGEYTISVPADKNILEFSSIGMRSVKVQIDGRSVINVAMEDDNVLLDDVVIVGYGTQRKKDVTSSISQIKGSD